MNITDIGKAVSAMFTEKERKVAQQEEIDKAKLLLTPFVVEKIADNEMPADFQPDRASYVAMAQLLDDALQLVESVLNTALHRPPGPGH